MSDADRSERLPFRDDEKEAPAAPRPPKGKKKSSGGAAAAAAAPLAEAKTGAGDDAPAPAAPRSLGTVTVKMSQSDLDGSRGWLTSKFGNWTFQASDTLSNHAIADLGRQLATRGLASTMSSAKRVCLVGVDPASAQRYYPRTRTAAGDEVEVTAAQSWDSSWRPFDLTIFVHSAHNDWSALMAAFRNSDNVYVVCHSPTGVLSTFHRGPKSYTAGEDMAVFDDGVTYRAHTDGAYPKYKGGSTWPYRFGGVNVDGLGLGFRHYMTVGGDTHAMQVYLLPGPAETFEPQLMGGANSGFAIVNLPTPSPTEWIAWVDTDKSVRLLDLPTGWADRYKVQSAGITNEKTHDLIIARMLGGDGVGHAAECRPAFARYVAHKCLMARLDAHKNRDARLAAAIPETDKESAWSSFKLVLPNAARRVRVALLVLLILLSAYSGHHAISSYNAVQAWWSPPPPPPPPSPPPNPTDKPVCPVLDPFTALREGPLGVAGLVYQSLRAAQGECTVEYPLKPANIFLNFFRPAPPPSDLEIASFAAVEEAMRTAMPGMMMGLDTVTNGLGVLPANVVLESAAALGVVPEIRSAAHAAYNAVLQGGNPVFAATYAAGIGLATRVFKRELHGVGDWFARMVGKISGVSVSPTFREEQRMRAEAAWGCQNNTCDMFTQRLAGEHVQAYVESLRDAGGRKALDAATAFSEVLADGVRLAARAPAAAKAQAEKLYGHLDLGNVVNTIYPASAGKRVPIKPVPVPDGDRRPWTTKHCESFDFTAMADVRHELKAPRPLGVMTLPGVINQYRATVHGNTSGEMTAAIFGRAAPTAEQLVQYFASDDPEVERAIALVHAHAETHARASARPPMDRERWINRKRSDGSYVFSATVRKELREAPAITKRDYALGGFVKRGQELSPAEPRLISPRKDAHKVEYGPHAHEFTRGMATLPGPLYSVAGVDKVVASLRMSTLIERHAPRSFVEFDVSRHDRATGPHIHAAYYDAIEKFGARPPPHFCSFYRSKHGEFHVIGGTPSGDTSTTAVGALHMRALLTSFAQFDHREVAPGIHGTDDGIVLADQDWLDSFIQFCSLTGVVVKGRVVRDIVHAEFNSGVFWPQAKPQFVDLEVVFEPLGMRRVVNIFGHVTHAFGPLPGRVIVRLGWTEKDLPRLGRLQQPLARLKGMRQLCSGTPVLRELTNAVAKLDIDAAHSYASLHATHDFVGSAPGVFERRYLVSIDDFTVEVAAWLASVKAGVSHRAGPTLMHVSRIDFGEESEYSLIESPRSVHQLVVEPVSSA